MSESAVPSTLRLKDLPAGSAGIGLGLRPGDLLVAVNGKGFTGDHATLRVMFGSGARDMALTFRRGLAEFTVLATTPDPGRWDPVPAPPDDGGRRRIDPALLRNWEVMRANDGSYDIFPHRLPATGLIVPQLWLMQMRLWLPCAMLVAAVAAGVIVHPLLALAVQAAGAAHLNWAHAIYLRLDRRTRGLDFQMVVAARGEAAAHAAYRAVQPEDRYLFAGAAKADETVTA